MAQRWRLLRERAALRRQAPARPPHGQSNATDWWLWSVSRRLKALQRRRARRREELRVAELRNAWARRDLAECNRLTLLIAGRGRGPRGPQYGCLPAARPTQAEWHRHLAQPGNCGGMKAERIDFTAELNKWCEEAEAERDLDYDHNKVERGREDLRDLAWQLKCAKKRRGTPP